MTAAPRRPQLVLFFGSCGSGKTTVSRRLAEAGGYSRFSTDEERARLFPGQPFDAGQNDALWASLMEGIVDAVRAGRSVVIDAAANRRIYRERIVGPCRLAADVDVRCVLVHVAPEVAWLRLRDRPAEMSPYVVGREDFERILSHIEIDPDERLFVFRNEGLSSPSIDRELDRLVAWLAASDPPADPAP